MQGKSRIISEEKIIYEGEQFKNKKHGHGTQQWPNDDLYIGEWKEGK